MTSRWFILEPIFWKLWPCLFFWHLIILLTDPILSHSPNFGRPKQGQTFVVPTFHIHFLNPECVRIPWVLAPKNFHVQNFRVRSVLQKSSIFHWFLLPPPKKKYRARVPTILMPETFPIASLNRYTPNFSGVPQKLTWCQQFGLQIFPKWGDADICRLEMAVFRCFFGRNKFSRPNGRLSPKTKAQVLSRNSFTCAQQEFNVTFPLPRALCIKRCCNVMQRCIF